MKYTSTLLILLSALANVALLQVSTLRKLVNSPSAVKSNEAWIVCREPETFSILLEGRVTVTEVVKQACGKLPKEKRNSIRVYRKQECDSAEMTIIRVDLKAIENRVSADLTLQPFDVVEVSEGKGRHRDMFALVPCPSSDAIAK